MEDRYDIDITFDSVENLEQKIDEGIEAILRWFDGDFYNESTEELRIRRMAKGGMTEHGLKVGDTIMGESKDLNAVFVRNNDQWHNVFLDKGTRYAKGGGVENELNIGTNIEFLQDLFVTQESDEYDNERPIGGKVLKIVKKDENNNIYYLKDTAQNLTRDDRFPYIIGFNKLKGWVENKYVKIHNDKMARGGGVSENFKYSKEYAGITIYTNTEQEYVGEMYSPFESKGSFKAPIRKGDLENIAIESTELKNFNFRQNFSKIRIFS